MVKLQQESLSTLLLTPPSPLTLLWSSTLRWSFILKQPSLLLFIQLSILRWSFILILKQSFILKLFSQPPLTLI